MEVERVLFRCKRQDGYDCRVSPRTMYFAFPPFASGPCPSSWHRSVTRRRRYLLGLVRSFRFTVCPVPLSPMNETGRSIRGYLWLCWKEGRWRGLVNTGSTTLLQKYRSAKTVGAGFLPPIYNIYIHRYIIHIHNNSVPITRLHLTLSSALIAFVIPSSLANIIRHNIRYSSFSFILWHVITIRSLSLFFPSSPIPICYLLFREYSLCLRGCHPSHPSAWPSHHLAFLV